MESQANRLAPRIQMPAGPFKAKANDYISRFMREMGARHEIEVMEAVIQQFTLRCFTQWTHSWITVLPGEP